MGVKNRLKPMSISRKQEIARYIIKNQHLNHKQRAYYLGLRYSTYMAVFNEMIAVYTVFMFKNEVIPELTEKSLEQRYLDTCFKK